jgi:hypothetical protein
VNFQKVFSGRTILSGLMLAVFALGVSAQSSRPMMTMETDRPWTVVGSNSLYCAGYIQSSAMSEGNKIMGAVDEADKYNFAQRDFMYLNMGSNKGVNVGDIFAVVRPRAKVKNTWSRKSDLGFYVQELGAVEVVSVKSDHSIARIKTSCDTFLLGDLVQLVEPRTSPPFEQRPPLDIFADPTGKATGRILMARDAAETLTRDFIVYVDLGADNNVKVGDRLTIFRPLGKGNVYREPEHEVVTERDYGFQSDVYRGGKFSNQAPRKTGDHAGGHEVSLQEAKRGRPNTLRKITGEAVVLNVKEKTATVVITQTASEIHTGDYVELQ